MAATKPKIQSKVVDTNSKPTMKNIRRTDIDDKTRNSETLKRNRKFVKG